MESPHNEAIFRTAMSMLNCADQALRAMTETLDAAQVDAFQAELDELSDLASSLHPIVPRDLGRAKGFDRD